MPSSYSGPNLVKIVTDIIVFSYDDYSGDDSPSIPPDENVIFNTAYICACFFAKKYDIGVEADWVVTELQLKTPMRRHEREQCVIRFNNQLIARK